MAEKGFEREERQERLTHAYASLDRLTTMRALGVPATLDQIITERRKSPASLDDSDSVSAASSGDDIVELAGILTEGEAK